MDFTLNGNPASAEPREDESLLELLRDRFGLWSVKDGCAPEGACGACTVIVEGRAVVSCAQPACRFAGKAVVTQEGLPAESRRLWADCFVAAGASQCGFCSPGIVMKAEAFLARHPDPTREQVAHVLLGNFCRCTGYVKIVDAILLAAAARRGRPLPEADRSGRVGARAPRYAGEELALGEEAFVGDITAPGLLHGALRFSDHPQARVLRIDTARALAHPGVTAVVTAADVPGERTQGALTRDWRQLVAVGEETAYVGDVLAAVAAETRHAAREAAALVDVEYEPLEPITSPFDPRRARSLDNGRRARGGRRGACGIRSRRPTQLSHAVHRARLPRAGVGARCAGAARDARLLAGSGRVGGPPPDRELPRPAGERRARDTGDRTAVPSAPRRTSTSRRTPLSSRTAPGAPSGSRSRVRRACASTPSATRCGSTTRPAATTRAV